MSTGARSLPVFAFRALLIGIALSTGVGVTFAVGQRPVFVEAFPGASSPVLYGSFLFVAAAGCVALAGLWYWRRWALWLYAVLAVAGVVLDIVARAPTAHQLTVVTAAVVVLGLAYLNRDRFRPGSEILP